mmetsp:Transcript_50518/g.117941  ORF Transcript_50518/g.117941 Transcript_50518/m.117941 type:complete len:200 (-) Transcript_50518:848-1447(-)
MPQQQSPTSPSPAAGSLNRQGRSRLHPKREPLTTISPPYCQFLPGSPWLPSFSPVLPCNEHRGECELHSTAFGQRAPRFRVLFSPEEASTGVAPCPAAVKGSPCAGARVPRWHRVNAPRPWTLAPNQLPRTSRPHLECCCVARHQTRAPGPGRSCSAAAVAPETFGHPVTPPAEASLLCVRAPIPKQRSLQRSSQHAVH